MTIPVTVRIASIGRISISIVVIAIAYLVGQALCVIALDRLGWWITIRSSEKTLICSLLLLFFVPLLFATFAGRKLIRRWADFRVFSSSRKVVYPLLALYLSTCFLGVPAIHAEYEEHTLPSCYQGEGFGPPNAGQEREGCGDYIAIPLLPNIIFYYSAYRKGFFSSGSAGVFVWIGIGFLPLYSLGGWIT